MLVACTQAPAQTPCTSVDDDEFVCGDFGPALGTPASLKVQGRLIAEDDDFELATTTPAHDLSQSELEHESVTARLLSNDEHVGEFTLRTDEEGWIDQALDLGSLDLQPGSFTLNIYAQQAWASSIKARLLAPDDTSLLVVSDVDLTYLHTDFQSKSALLQLLDQSAAERATLPAMELIYPALRSGAQGRENRPLIFVSGSPQFFRRTLNQKLVLDGIEADALRLKPFKALLDEDLGNGGATVLLAGALSGDLRGVAPSVTDQLGYKLWVLLELQLEVPLGMRWLLLGDDSETDHVAYALFHELAAGSLNEVALLETLATLQVDSVLLDEIAALAPQVADARDGRGSPVTGIFINQTDVPNQDQAVNDWKLPGLTHLHQGAWPLVLMLRQADLLGDQHVVQVRKRLLDLGATEAVLTARAEAAVARGDLRPSFVARSW